MKKLIIMLALAFGGSAVLPSTAHAAPYCGLYWTLLPHAAFDFQTNEVVSDVQTDQLNECYDTMTIYFNGPSSGYTIQYVNEVTEEGTGAPVPLEGDAQLQIHLRAPGYDAQGAQIYPGNTGEALPGVDVSDYQTFREAKFAGRSANAIRLGLGVREKLPMRITKMPDRIVIRVAHQF